MDGPTDGHVDRRPNHRVRCGFPEGLTMTLEGTMAGSMQDAFAASGVEAPAPVPGHDGEVGDREASAGVRQLGGEVIRPGLVVLEFDPVDFLSQPDVVHTGNPATRLGPFVCIGVSGSHATWAGLTSRWRIERLEIPVSWRLGGPERWRMGRQYLTDGATRYQGPIAAGAAASWRTVFGSPQDLPRLSDDGLEAVILKVRASAGRAAESRRRLARRRENFRRGKLTTSSRPLDLGPPD